MNKSEPQSSTTPAMRKFEIKLPVTGYPVFIETDDKVVLPDRELDVIRTSVAEAIAKAVPGLKVTPLPEGRYCRRDLVVAESATFKAGRHPNTFAAEFPKALQNLAADLAGKLNGKTGVHVMEMRFNDDEAFAKENQWGDWLYIYARLAPIEKC